MFGYEAKAPELVCVAIGVNLLFPVAPSILRKFLSFLETDVDKVLAKAFGDSKFLMERDVSELKKVSDEISEEQRRCAASRFGWPLADVIAAAIGVALLWTGLVKPLGGWCILLFLPPVAALAMAWRRYRVLRDKHRNTVARIADRIRVRAEDAAARRGGDAESRRLSTLVREVSEFLCDGSRQPAAK